MSGAVRVIFATDAQPSRATLIYWLPAATFTSGLVNRVFFLPTFISAADFNWRWRVWHAALRALPAERAAVEDAEAVVVVRGTGTGGGQGGYTDSVQLQFGRLWPHFITLVRTHHCAAVLFSEVPERAATWSPDLCLTS